jgi:hypothetical protein
VTLDAFAVLLLGASWGAAEARELEKDEKRKREGGKEGENGAKTRSPLVFPSSPSSCSNPLLSAGKKSGDRVS